jgi:hypothetical protein
MLGRSPGFTATALAVIALGIGANSAVFPVVNAVLLKPLPYPEADRLVRVMVKSPGGMLGLTSVLNFSVWRQTAKAFDLIAAYDGGITDGQLKAAHVAASLHSGQVRGRTDDRFLSSVTEGLRPAKFHEKPRGAQGISRYARWFFDPVSRPSSSAA